MVTKHKKLLSLLVLACFVVTLFPSMAFAFVSTDNIGTAAVKNAKGNWIGGDTFGRGYVPETFRLIGYWDVIHKNTKEKLGKAPVIYLREADAPKVGMEPGCYTMVNPNTLESWVEAFNGNLDFVKSKVEPKPHFLTRDSDGQTFPRYWLRDIAYASGASIEPDTKKEVIYASTSWTPVAMFEDGIEEKTFVAGESSNIGIYGESWVLYRQTPGGYPGLTWELQVDGETIKEGSVKTMKTKKFEEVPYTFCCEGEYILILIVTDGVGRQTKAEVKVNVEPGEEVLPPEEEEEVEVPEGNPNLKLTATSLGGKDVFGTYHPPEQRPAGTVKLTDMIKAEFTAPSAPKLSPCYRLEKWELQSATIIYPKKNEKFTFDHPLAPVGTASIPMTVDKKNNTATVEFQEDWSMNGAFVYDILEDKMIPGPTKYDITVKYEILWEYEKGVRKTKTNSKGKTVHYCDNYKFYSKTKTETVTAQILVNGTGKTRVSQ